MFRPDCKASRVIFRTGSKKQPPMKGSPAIGTRLLNGLELKHQSRFGLDCLNDHSIAEELRLLIAPPLRARCADARIAPSWRAGTTSERFKMEPSVFDYDPTTSK